MKKVNACYKQIAWDWAESIHLENFVEDGTKKKLENKV